MPPRSRHSKRGSIRSSRRTTSATGCSVSPTIRIPNRLALRQGRTPNSSPDCSAPGAMTPRSKSSRSCSPLHKLRRLEMTAPTHFTASLSEPVLARSDHSEGALLPYNAYSPDGDVTGELVYVNLGMQKDYADLERRGIDVRGKIVLVRYGGGWRGLKPKFAAEHGAIGCIVFSDSRPFGWLFPGRRLSHRRLASRAGSAARLDARHHGLRRRSAHPRWSAPPPTPCACRARRRSRFRASPVLPISYADALPLLKALAGPVAPDEWRGGLPRHLSPRPGTGAGASRNRVRLADGDGLRRPRPALAGSEHPEEWILRGNHPARRPGCKALPIRSRRSSRCSARRKAVGSLARQGWRPKPD